jgi:hypothetical protein
MKESRPTPGPAVIVHCFEHALAAIEAAGEFGRGVILVSAPGAAGTVGAPWFLEVVRQAAATRPDVTVTAIVDCGDQPGFALGALRTGADILRFTGRKAVAEKLAAIARQQGASLVTTRIKALDLLDDPDPPGACRRWLEAARPCAKIFPDAT